MTNKVREVREVPEGQEVLEAAEVTEAKRPKKLIKSIEGTVVTIEAIGGNKGPMKFDTTKLPDAVKEKLIPFGASHKLGDSAAGRSGTDAEEAIEKTWEGLMKGDMSVRQPAVPKVTVSSLKTALDGMSEEDAAKARELLAQMGVNL